jgi:hypothetical protein
MATDPGVREGELGDRIRELYARFRRYGLSPPDPGSPGRDDRPLRTEMLNRLPSKAFQEYQWSAIYSWGSVDDFKHFLPRLLELIAQPAAGRSVTDVQPWPIFAKLSYADWQRWPRREREALDRYFEALWRAILARPVPAVDSYSEQTPNHWLFELAHAHTDLAPFLGQWESDLADPDFGQTATAHLARWVVCDAETLLESNGLRWRHQQYPNLGAQADEAVAWLASDKVFALLESAYFRWSESTHAALLSEGHESLHWWRQRRMA